jgi:hypothetical protein
MDKRRFPRVDFRKIHPNMQQILGATAQWASGEQTAVFDLSHTGAAVGVPKNNPVSPGEQVALQFHIEKAESASAQCHIVRVGEHVVGVQFTSMDTASRLKFEKFLQSKLMGLSVRLVNPHFYGAKEDFTYWFHGPQDFNVFIWEQKHKVLRALVELGRELLHFENGQFSEGQKTNDPSDTEGEWTRKNITEMTPLMRKTLEILSQVQESKELLEPLIHVLVQRAK